MVIQSPLAQIKIHKTPLLTGGALSCSSPCPMPVLFKGRGARTAWQLLEWARGGVGKGLDDGKEVDAH